MYGAAAFETGVVPKPKKLLSLNSANDLPSASPSPDPARLKSPARPLRAPGVIATAKSDGLEEMPLDAQAHPARKWTPLASIGVTVRRVRPGLHIYPPQSSPSCGRLYEHRAEDEDADILVTIIMDGILRRRVEAEAVQRCRTLLASDCLQFGADVRPPALLQAISSPSRHFRKIHVHCRAGLARSNCVQRASAWLMTAYILTFLFTAVRGARICSQEDHSAGC